MNTISRSAFLSSCNAPASEACAFARPEFSASELRLPEEVG